ncbi:MAG: ammonia channel protein, partial [Microcystis sp.]
MKKIVGITRLLLGLGFNCGIAPVFAETIAAAPPNPISAGDTAWMLISSALVLLMTPGLAFFYGGLVRSSNVLNTMM